MYKIIYVSLSEIEENSAKVSKSANSSKHCMMFDLWTAMTSLKLTDDFSLFISKQIRRNKRYVLSTYIISHFAEFDLGPSPSMVQNFMFFAILFTP